MKHFYKENESGLETGLYGRCYYYELGRGPQFITSDYFLLNQIGKKTMIHWITNDYIGSHSLDRLITIMDIPLSEITPLNIEEQYPINKKLPNIKYGFRTVGESEAEQVFDSIKN